MKRLPILLFAIAMMFFNGCAVAGGIFKGGVAIGVIGVVVVILVIIWLFSLFRGK
ncbi:phosphatidate cytidylyltransferase [Mucilaginibacter ginkgonis]|uniref:Uncharacterized protein n=1 Tax=Mucilaginibacter ginkgonis TaxID=2682091 RepID=A0A6I4I1W8_9SPHI|nr:phosphatidate cytidylyltransferase [Mucilaginibacter ginkgonis]QQL48385.1 hypothetical protein GO620_009275 [Mucilaginibacter ginkgonis]